MKKEKEFFGLRTGLTWASIGYVVVGAVLLICTLLPNSLPLSQLCFSLGVLLLIVGGISVLLYLLRKSVQVKGRMGFAGGAACILFGLYAVLNANDFARMFSLILGLCMLLDCVVKMQFSLELCRAGSHTWPFVMGISAGIAALALIILINPFGSENVRDIYTYCVLIGDGIANLVLVALMWAQSRKLKTIDKPGQEDEP